MEYWYAATGPKHWLDLHITHMQSQPFMITGTAPNGQTFQQGMNGILEPVMLFRYIIPKGGENLVLNTFAPYKKDKFGINIMAATLRKALGLEPIPEHTPMVPKLNASMDYLNIIPIGIKDDGPDRIMAPTGVKQEGI